MSQKTTANEIEDSLIAGRKQLEATIADLRRQIQDHVQDRREIGRELDRQKAANLKAFMALQKGIDSGSAGELYKAVVSAKRTLGAVS